MTRSPADLKLSSNFGKNVVNNLRYYTNQGLFCIILVLVWIWYYTLDVLYFMVKSLFKGWLFMMDKLGRRRIIMDRNNNEPYLERYYLFLRNRGENFPFNIFLHKFLKSDPDDLHDHPWSYTTLILWGGYWEYRENCGEITKHWCGPGYFATRPATWKHRIELNRYHSPCWTLFIPYKKKRTWGFYRPNEGGKEEWIESDQYFLEKTKEKGN